MQWRQKIDNGIEKSTFRYFAIKFTMNDYKHLWKTDKFDYDFMLSVGVFSTAVLIVEPIN